jgi:hypothetical protein
MDDNEKDYGNNTGREGIVMSNASAEGNKSAKGNASDEVTSASNDPDGDKDMQDLLSNTSSEREDAQDTTSTNTERLRMSVEDL